MANDTSQQPSTTTITIPQNKKITIEKPWLKYYPEEIKKLKVKKYTLNEIIKKTCINEDLIAIKFWRKALGSLL